MIIIGLNRDSIEIHILNSYKNQYIDKLHIIEDVDRAVERIKRAKEIHQCEDIILDEKTLSKALLEKMREEGLIAGVV